MKNQKLTCWMLVCGLVVTIAAAGIAQAHPQFQKQFVEKYIKGHSNKEFVTLVQKKAKCFVCHDPKKDEKGKTSKKNRNAYGNELAKQLTKKDKKDIKKIQRVLEEVSKLKSDAKDPNSPTFGELIEQGKLPGGSLPTEAPEESEEEEEEDKQQ